MVTRQRPGTAADAVQGVVPRLVLEPGAVVELARVASVATPHLDAVFALTRLLAAVAEAERQGTPVALHPRGTA